VNVIQASHHWAWCLHRPPTDVRSFCMLRVFKKLSNRCRTLASLVLALLAKERRSERLGANERSRSELSVLTHVLHAASPALKQQLTPRSKACKTTTKGSRRSLRSDRPRRTGGLDRLGASSPELR
jgi:hypothetical protein